MRRFVTAGIALVALASTACVKQNDAGVGIAKFDSSAVFGIAVEKPVVPGFDVPEDTSDLTLPDLPTPTPQNPVAPQGPCPPAKLTAFPKAAATPQVRGMPTEGLYTWKRNSFELKNTANKAKPLQFLPFALQGRGVRRVVKEGDHQFSFEMVAPDPFSEDGTVVTGFRVNTNPALIVNQRVASRTIGIVPVPGQDVRIANPGDDPGIFVTKIEQLTAKGVRTSIFEPVQPMRIVPLEEGIIRSGQAFRSFGIDATTGAVIVNDGIVGRTNRVDACGEIVEGYAVSLHQILTNDIQNYDGLSAVVAQQETRSVDYIFATQYGALPIGETLSIGDVNSPAADFAISALWELGGLTPKPLPDSLK
jgi:hypothetical protein